MKYVIWILAGAVIILVISQWKSCNIMAGNDRVVDTLQTEKKVIQHQRDSIINHDSLIWSADSVLRIEYRRDTTLSHHTIDSLKSLYVTAQGKLQNLKIEMKQIQIRMLECNLVA